ncbi:hypothetical protein ACM55G_13085 [Flavobacterium sp. LB3P122]|uniref:hypothetical protein n=1 Tax=Flavobacterium algoriphilum TaxID=3398738 RepID=UPI003A880065
MSYTNYLGEIFKFIGLPALISIGVTAIAKLKYDKKLEKVKFRNAKKLSDFQSEIEILKSQESIKFAKLHEKRFEVLAEIYKYINDIIVALHNSITPVKNETNVSFEENEKKLLNNYRLVIFSFYEYFAINKIYLSANIASLIDNFVMQANIIASENAMKKGQAGMEVYSKLNEIVIPIKNEIEIEFRKVLGE